MKTIVSMQDFLEAEIKPNESLAQYSALTAHDAQELLLTTPLHMVACPACQSVQRELVFEKNGFTYWECTQCASLYVSPRPTETALINFYRQAPSAKFWREQILAQTEAARLEKVIQPRAEWVLDGLAEYLPKAQQGLDLSSHGKLLVQTLLATASHKFKMTAAHPLADLDYATPVQGVAVSPKAIADLATLPAVDFILAFDVLDRCVDISQLFESLTKILRPGGLFFATFSSINGFDLQILGKDAPSLILPDRLNLLSLKGTEQNFSSSNWEICEISTPGAFDVEVVQRNLPLVSQATHKFWRRLFSSADHEFTKDFQEFLQAHRLSSFARLLVRRH
jgi:hypothetical protein